MPAFIGGDEHFGHVENVVFEILTDDAHARDEAFAQDFLHGPALGQRGPGHLLDFLGLAFVKALVH
jgi:hypothetical protein